MAQELAGPGASGLAQGLSVALPLLGGVASAASPAGTRGLYGTIAGLQVAHQIGQQRRLDQARIAQQRSLSDLLSENPEIEPGVTEIPEIPAGPAYTAEGTLRPGAGVLTSEALETGQPGRPGRPAVRLTEALGSGRTAVLRRLIESDPAAVTQALPQIFAGLKPNLTQVKRVNPQTGRPEIVMMDVSRMAPGTVISEGLSAGELWRSVGDDAPQGPAVKEGMSNVSQAQPPSDFSVGAPRSPGPQPQPAYAPPPEPVQPSGPQPVGPQAGARRPSFGRTLHVSATGEPSLTITERAPQAPQFIETVDAQGRPVRIAVTPQEGQQFPIAPPQRAPQFVETVDAQGRPIRIAVTPQEGQAFPVPPPQRAPQFIETVDAQGRPVRRAVTPQGGEEFPIPPPQREPVRGELVEEVDPATGQRIRVYRDPTTGRRIGAPLGPKPAGAPSPSDIGSMQSRFLQQARTLDDVRDAYARIERVGAGAPSPFGDMSLIYGYIKMLDPATGIKEGEIALADQTKGLDQRLVGLYNRAVTGQLLTPAQRTDVLRQTGQLAAARIEGHEQLEREFSRIAQSQGMDPSAVVPDLLGPLRGRIKAAGAAPTKPRAATRAEYARARRDAKGDPQRTLDLLIQQGIDPSLEVK
jgi:hypothetical protein